MNDEFDSLFVDEVQLNKEILLEGLKNKVRLTKNRNILFEVKVPGKKKLILVLLAQRVYAHKGISESEGLTPKEIQEMTGMAGGTIRPYLIQLSDERIIFKEDNEYKIPNYSIKRAVEYLEEGKEQ